MRPVIQNPLCPRCGGLLVEEWDKYMRWLECTACGEDYDHDDARLCDEDEAA